MTRADRERIKQKAEEYKKTGRAIIASREAEKAIVNAPDGKMIVVKTKKSPFPPAPPRLPSGAIYYAAYNADEQKWHGTLTVLGKSVSEEIKVEAGCRSHFGLVEKLFRLADRLDKKYRASLEEKS